MAFNQSESTSEDLLEKKLSVNFVEICEVIIGAFGIVGNLTCVFVLRRRSVRNHTNWLIVNQAIVDALASFLLVAAVSSKAAGASPTTMTRTSAILYCKIWGSQGLVFSGFAISTFNLTAISIERYIAVVHPVWYLAHFKRRAMSVLITLTWLLAPALQLVTISTQYGVFPNGECNFYAEHNQILIALFFWEYFIPICIMTFSFVSIIVKFRKLNKIAADRSQELQQRPHTVGTSFAEQCPQNGNHVHTIQPARSWNGTHNPEATTSRPNNGSLPMPSRRPQDQASKNKAEAVGRIQRRNTTKVLIAVYVIFLICWSPNQWAFLQFNLGGYLDFNSVFYRLTVIMGILNTCINPFIYALRLKIYQRELKAIIRSFPCTTT